jgi:hypothetical protein
MAIEYATGREMVAGPTPLPTGIAVATGSPEWWLKRLLATLIARAAECNEYATFYDGHQPLAFASERFVQTYGVRFGRFPANFMPLVVDAERERLIVDGFRFGSNPEADKGVWRIWQQNMLDAESQIAHEIALTKGVAFAAVDPFNAVPTITIEDPSETVVETSSGNRRIRRAALKVVADDDGYYRAWLYLPTEVWSWRSTTKRTDTTTVSLSTTRWTPFGFDGDVVRPNPLGVVPIIPLINRPRRDGTGRSEIETVMGNQLAINFLRYAALVGSDSSALPQRWAKNLEIVIDEATGQPKVPFRTGRDVLWTSRRPSPDEVADYPDGAYPEVDFGQFPEASLQPFALMIRGEVGQMASNSRTPYHYLLGDPTSVPPSGESLKSSEAPLVKKVEAEQIHLGEGWEETMRVALLAAGQKTKAAASTGAETIWRDAETRNEAARTDSILKQYQAGLLPDEFALQELGYSQQQIERIRVMNAASAQARAAAPTTEPAAVPPTGVIGQPPVPVP